jgi:hypothetical protein
MRADLHRVDPVNRPFGVDHLDFTEDVEARQSAVALATDEWIDGWTAMGGQRGEAGKSLLLVWIAEGDARSEVRKYSSVSRLLSRPSNWRGMLL